MTRASTTSATAPTLDNPATPFNEEVVGSTDLRTAALFGLVQTGAVAHALSLTRNGTPGEQAAAHDFITRNA